jgi:DNA-3-methyladenine glycosylase II
MAEILNGRKRGAAAVQEHIAATEKARESLAGADPVMGALTDKYGVIDYELRADYLDALMSNIIGQQLSGRVADVLWGRFTALCGGEITVEKVLGLSDAQLRGAGISRNKSAYLRNVASAVKTGALTLGAFDGMTDEAVIGQLKAVKGIGEWTAEMFLIFSLGRQDVFSMGDGGLARAVNALYGDGKELASRERAAIAERWKPYRSIASLYLWRSLDNR